MRYPIPWGTASRLAVSLLGERQRCINEDGQRSLATLPTPARLAGQQYLPPQGRCLITCNHYTRPGLPAWWTVLAISAAVPYPIHWVITSALTFNRHPLKKPFTPLTRLVLSRVAQVYGFTTMPPMPPHPGQAAGRARSVRRVLAYARESPCPVVGLAPEGRDTEQSILQQPPPGAGRFMLHLARLGLCVVPAGVFEESQRFNVQFGKPFQLDFPPGLPAADIDRLASQQVMQAIARLLPERMRGEWADGSRE